MIRSLIHSLLSSVIGGVCEQYRHDSNVCTQGGGGSSLLYISIAYYMQTWGGGGEGIQIACKIAYVLNGKPLKRGLEKRDEIKYLWSKKTLIKSEIP